jgi:hypothetical protein
MRWLLQLALCCPTQSSISLARAGDLLGQRLDLLELDVDEGQRNVQLWCDTRWLGLGRQNLMAVRPR